MRTNRRWNGWLVAALFASLWAGCGGESHSSAGRGTQGPRTIDGVPIGDCEVPSRSELSALGCPEALPEGGTPCDTPDGIDCYYGISVDSGSSYQAASICNEGMWYAYGRTCGTTCRSNLSNQILINNTDCENRAEEECNDILFASPPSAQQLLDKELSLALSACSSSELVNVSIELVLENGCPREISASQPFMDEVADCLFDRLKAVRWECARTLSCATYSAYLL